MLAGSNERWWILFGDLSVGVGNGQSELRLFASSDSALVDPRLSIGRRGPSQ